jgi:hypothetical protein
MMRKILLPEPVVKSRDNFLEGWNRTLFSRYLLPIACTKALHQLFQLRIMLTQFEEFK